jgi:YegS/Rv2252/BmrU family lipid kinase
MAIYKNAVLFYNTDSGHSKKGKRLDPIRSFFSNHNIPLEIIKFPLPEEDLTKTIEKANIDHADLVIAAGGDGTMALVAGKLIGSEIPLAVLPLGTGNLLAQELKIPINLDKALSLIIAETSKIIKMDTIKVKDRHCLLNVSVGITPRVMKKTGSEEKQRFGIFAYIVHFFQQFLGLKLNRYFIEYDQQNVNFLASEVLITNGQVAGADPLKWADDVAINDGRLDLFIIRATNIKDIINLIASFFSKSKKRSDVLKYIQFHDYCRIETQTPIPTQADGDAFTQTPVEIRVIPKSLNIIVSENYKTQENLKGVQDEKI